MMYNPPPTAHGCARRAAHAPLRLLSILTATCCLLIFARASASAQSVVVNKYFNSGTGAGDAVELLVVQNNLDMRGMIVKDFTASMASDNGGKFQFSNSALWSSVRAGTLVVLRNDASAADTSAGGADFNLDVGLQNATFFTDLGGTFDIAATEMLMIKSAGSGAAGVAGSVHALAGGAAGSFFNSAPEPKLRATSTSGTNQFVFANNTNAALADYNGTGATGSAAGLTLGAANNATNALFIDGLRGGPPPPAPPDVRVSQLYGGGGNSGAPFQNDFIELYNAGSSPVDLSGWSVQYNSAAGTDAWEVTALSGTIQPGRYLLVKEAAGTGCSGAPCGAALPAADVDPASKIALSGTSGKVALVNATTPLVGGCPAGSPVVVDLVGYGTATCAEGGEATPALSNTQAALRLLAGCVDYDKNFVDFTTGAPAPRNSASPASVCGDPMPLVFATMPGRGAAGVAVGSSVTITFTEPVNVTGNWFGIACTTSGAHAANVAGGPTVFTLDPAADFVLGERCTITITAARVGDQDADDPPDNLTADYVFDFATGHEPGEHLLMGNPSNATADAANDTNFLMEKPQYVLSYHRARAAPNWASWHLDASWIGAAERQDDFRADPTLPADWYHVQGTDFTGSGFDRGHVCPSADRTSTVADNSATFLMTNMLAQAPDNNQGPWADLEDYARTLVEEGGEVYIVAGGAGQGGVGENGFASTIVGGNVAVPALTWKVLLVLPAGNNDLARVNTSTRAVAVVMPNTQGIRFDNWRKYLATVDQVEALTGHDLFSAVPASIQNVIEARLDDQNNATPVGEGQTAATVQNAPLELTLAASDFNVNNSLSFTVVVGPAHGQLSAPGPATCAPSGGRVRCTARLTYTPALNYSGPDSFTFRASDGGRESAAATVQIEVAAAPPTVQFAQHAYTPAESNVAGAVLSLRRTGDASGASSVSYATADDPAALPCNDTQTLPGVALSRCDFAATIDRVTFLAGELTKTINVPLVDDGHDEPDETFRVLLFGPSAGTTLGAQATAEVTLTDDDTATTPNPILLSPFFVRMHYLDFLSREPEAEEPWTNILNNCPNRLNTDPNSLSALCDCITVSRSFFESPEFRLKGFYVFLFYRAAFGRLARYDEIVPDMRSVTGSTPAEVFERRAAFAADFTERPEFKNVYDALSDAGYVGALLARYNTTSITTPDPAAPDGTQAVTLTAADLSGRLAAGTLTRAQVLRAVVQSREADAAEFHHAFVAMQYYGYLRRTPEDDGFQAWLRVIRRDPNNIRIMIQGFINSQEYALRFGRP